MQPQDTESDIHRGWIAVLGRIARSMKHDLNNRLAVVTTYADLVGDELPAGSPGFDDLRAIKTAAESGVAVLNWFCRLTTPRLDPEHGTPLGEILTELEPALRCLIGGEVRMSFDSPSGSQLFVAEGACVARLILTAACLVKDSTPSGGGLVIAARGAGSAAGVHIELRGLSEGTPPTRGDMDEPCPGDGQAVWNGLRGMAAELGGSAKAAYACGGVRSIDVALPIDSARVRSRNEQ